MKLPSAHKLPRAENCPGSQVLPAFKEPPGEPAERGKRIHEFLQNVLELGREKALEKADALTLQWVEHIDTDSLPASLKGQLSGERLYVWNPTTDEVACHEPDDRKVTRPELAGCMVAIADVSGYNPNTLEGYVGDYKTGRVAVDPAHVNLQIGFPAWVMSRLYGLDTVLAEIIYVREDDDHYTSRAKLDVFALDDIEQRLRRTVVAVYEQYERLKHNKPVEVNLGSWCRYCPSFHACPGQIRLLNALASDPTTVMHEIDTELVNARAAVAYEKLKAVKLAIGEVEGKLKAYAKENPIELGDGRVYGETVSQRAELNGAIAFKVITEKWGPDVALSAVDIAATKASIERAVRPLKAPGLTIKGMQQELLDKIGEAGGIKTSTRRTLKEHRPKS